MGDRYLRAEVTIHCVDEETVGAALAKLDAAVRAAFPSDLPDDVEVEAVESAGLT